MRRNILVTEFGERNSKKPSLIVLHGGPSIPLYTHPLSKRLSEHYHVVDYIQRSREHTQALPPFSMKSHREDLRELVNEKISTESKSAILIGHSWGALLALNFISHFPEAPIKALLLICPAPLEIDAREKFSQKIETRLTSEQLAQRKEILRKVKESEHKENNSILWTEYWKLIVPAYFYDSSRALQFPWPLWDYECFEATLRSASEEHKKGTFLAMKEKVHQPINVIGGMQDPIPTRLVFDWIRKNFSQARLSELKNCGHFPWMEGSEIAEKFFSVLHQALDKLIDSKCHKA